ncbi:MAG TPA: PAS domain S-box protein [Gemmataceae bacterium]|nr:PAS domain S-box protein [Gemmataceae bacterium]
MSHRSARARLVGVVVLIGGLIALGLVGILHVPALVLGLVVGLVAGYTLTAARPPAPAEQPPDDRDRLIAKLRDDLTHFSAHGARVREERLRLLESAVVHAHDAVVILESEPRRGPGPGRKVLYVNDAFCRLSGYGKDEVLGRSLHFLRGPDSDAVTLDRIGRALADCQPLRVELLNYRKDGSPFWVDLSLVPVPDPDGRCAHWVMIQRDVSDRKRSEDELRRSEERYRHLFDSNPHPMWVVDKVTAEFLAVNDAAVHKYGYSRDEFLSMTIADIRPPEDVDRAVESLRGRGPGYQPPEPWRHITKTGSQLDVEVSSFVLTLDGRLVHLVLVNDVTEKLRLEARLQKAQKMEVIGQLAGGIAHDFNNLLTAVLGNLSLVTLPEDDPNAPLLATVEQAAGRAAELTAKLLGYARRNQIARGAVDPQTAFDEVVGLLGRTIDPRIRIEVDVAAGCGPVLADPNLLNQALLNLCVNARDAMPEGGTLTLSAEPFTATATDLEAHPDAVGGEFVRVSVIDTGTGMSDEVRARLFEPFFTTKDVGQGTGLGLPMVHGVMKQHQGWVDVRSVLGAGTRVDLFLPPPTTPARGVRVGGGPTDTPPPKNSRTVAEQPAPVPPVVVGHSAEAQTSTILLVDDESMIRDLGQVVLEQNGFRVLLAEDGTDGVEVFAQRHAEIDLVVLDVTMPRMSGRDAFRHMVQLVPDARVLFSTGYSADDVAGLDGAIGLLSKPYRPHDLLAAVRAALAENSRAVCEPAGAG